MMEMNLSQFYNPHVLRVLKNFQTAAGQSLKGPSNLGEESTVKFSVSEMDEYRKSLESMSHKLDITMEDSSENVNPQLVKTAPVLMPMDCYTGEKMDTLLEGDRIACFLLGGEKRLCLPQIINTMLREFKMEEVHEAVTELHIFLSRCTHEQLQMLKGAGVLPTSAPSCGLITKTDAERLCSKLLHATPTRRRLDPPSANSFKVYHECFGKCKGIFCPELYSSPDSLCIECYECHGMYTPAKFVCHSHKASENRTCHWGFDSDNWRSYLLLAKDQEYQERLIQCLEDMKDQFQPVNKLKRKKCDSEGDTPTKRITISSSAIATNASNKFKFHPKFRKVQLPASIDQGPPKLLNPDRVVPFSEHKRYGRDFVPNVSLAPASPVYKQKPSNASTSDEYESDDEDFDDNDDEVATGSHLVVTGRSYELELSSDSSSDSECSSGCSLKAPLKRNSSNIALDLSLNAGPNHLPSLKSPAKCHAGRRKRSVNSNRFEKEAEFLTLLRQALDGKETTAGNKSSSAEDSVIITPGTVLAKFEELQRGQRVQLSRLEKNKAVLKEEVEFYKKKARRTEGEEGEKGNELKREVDRLKMERDVWSGEATEERLRHRHEVEALRDSHRANLVQIKAKYKSQLELARTKVNQFEQLFVQMGQEIAYLRGELKKYGKETIELPYSIAKSQVATATPPVAYVVGRRSSMATESQGQTEEPNGSDSIVKKNSRDESLCGVS